jgi:hypothetical protein
MEGKGIEIKDIEGRNIYWGARAGAGVEESLRVGLWEVLVGSRTRSRSWERG